MNKNRNTKIIANAVGAHDCARKTQNNLNKPIANAVGAPFGRPQDHRGITLIALIITIIVMLILVGVSITIALKGGLFETTKRAAKGTEAEKNAEQELASGRVKIDGTWYDSIEDYVGGKESEDQTDPEKPVKPVEPEQPVEPVSYLGRTATIDGQKYIVLYDAGEQGENVQLISANVLEVDNVYLGKGDGQIDWTNASVIVEADLDNNNTLDDTEKAIYSYKHAIETLNKKCESLVGTTNPDIVSVRSVGSNPTSPSSESEGYTSDFLANNPTNEPGKYNGVGKSTDENYLTDYDRMRELRISVTENNAKYWLASRMLNEEGLVHFNIRNISENGVIEEANVSNSLWIIGRSSAVWQCDLHYGVRPVVSLKSDAISKYLD